MRLLAFDTAGSVSAVALVADDAGQRRVLAEDDSPSTGRHGQVLLPRIEAVLTSAALTLADIDALGVGLGPGSFTGLRVGLATAKGLALATGRPLVGVGSPCALARAVPSAELVLCVLDAFKGEVYAGLFRNTPQGPASVLDVFHARPEDAARAVHDALHAAVRSALGSGAPGKVLALGDGARRYAELFSCELGPLFELGAESLDCVRGRHVAEEAVSQLALRGPSDLATLEPSYVRGSDAQLPARPLAV